VVDDEPQLRRFMRTALTQAGYEIDDARDGESALLKLRDFRPDLVILDWNMPGMSGLAACREIRQAGNAAIVVLTVRNAEREKVAALDAGADDFVTKPFSTPELLARIRAALRRVPASPSAPMRVRLDDLEIDFGARAVLHPSGAVHLTPKELDLLRYLISHPNRTVSHRELLQAVWGPDYGDQVDYLRAVVRSLRKKIEDNPEEPRYILTEHWVGYRLQGSPQPV